MARKPTKTGTAVANYDEEMARLASQAAGLTDKGGGGKFFSTRAGQLSFDDTPLPGNQMAVVIVDWCLENIFYADTFDPENRAPPTCFAFCKDPSQKDEMGPVVKDLEDEAFEQQADTCGECPNNEWGSAAKGKGKACGNRRRLALLSAGVYRPVGKGGGFEYEEYDDPDHYKSTDEGYLKVPVTSGKAFDSYVREIAEQFGKPLFGVLTRVWLTPDSNTQFKVNFELIDVIDKDDPRAPVIYERYLKIHESIDFPYVPFKEDEAEEPKARTNKKLAGKAKAKPATRGRR